MKQSSLGTKLFMVILTLGVLTYFGIQGYRYFSDPLSITLAYHYRVEEELTLSGYVVRQEQVLANHDSGLLQLRRQEGERVSKGGTVALVYADEASLAAQDEIAALTARIEQLEYAQEAAQGIEAAMKLDSQIMQSILEFRAGVTAGRLTKAETSGKELRTLVLKREYTYTGTEDFSTQISELKSQKKTLQGQTAGSVRRITAPVSGLFSAVVDGYEGLLTPEGLQDLTPSELADLQAEEGAASRTGKLILGDAWYYAAPMTAAQAETLKKAGGTLSLRFSKHVERDLPVTLDSIGPEENGRVVAVFRGETYLPQLTLLRHQSAQLVYETIEGIRVPTEALRMAPHTIKEEDGTETTTQVTGLYCIVGMEARFKPVEVLHNGDGFVLVRSAVAANQEGLRLRPGDEVIITARNLFDGKVVG